jgi:endonuclease YncB( thermonuclease family)
MPPLRRRWSGPRLPRLTPARLLAPVVLGGLAVVTSAWAQEPKSRGATPLSPCRIETFANGTVKTVVDGRTFVLADGREVRLTGIEVPPLPDSDISDSSSQAPNGQPAAQSLPPKDSGQDLGQDPGQNPGQDPGLAAAAALGALVTGQEVILTHAKAAIDRYGRLLADAVVGRDGAARSVAKTLVGQGFARVAARPGEAACAAELHAAERTARTAKLGLWSDPRYFSKQAENVAEVSAERGRFTLVEGKVVSVRESGSTIYVNFGRRWSEDFTVTILKRNERLFVAAGLPPSRLSGRRVLVRGWVEERGGPWIEASAPDQIEIIADK